MKNIDTFSESIIEDIVASKVISASAQHHFRYTFNRLIDSQRSGTLAREVLAGTDTVAPEAKLAKGADTEENAPADGGDGANPSAARNINQEEEDEDDQISGDEGADADASTARYRQKHEEEQEYEEEEGEGESHGEDEKPLLYRVNKKK